MAKQNQQSYNLIIIGARGWGREVLWAARQKEIDGEFTIKGFLDDDSHALDGLVGDFPPILSSVEDYEVQPNDIFFCALGDPASRKKYADIIEAKGGYFVTYISPKATVSPNTTIAEGCFIDEYVSISDNTHIGKHCVIQRLATIGHDTKIGNHCTIGAYTFCGGASTIGDGSTLHVRSTIIRNVNIGENSVVGAGSVVIKSTKPDSHVFGVPAKNIL